jgi:hypothetical protein
MNIEQIFPLQEPNVEVRNGTPFGSETAADMMPHAGPRNTDEVSKDIWKRRRQIQAWVFAGTREWGFTVSSPLLICSCVLDLKIWRPDETS